MKVKATKFGRGIFSTRRYSAGDAIETCQLIILDKNDRLKIDDTKLYDYYFSWGSSDDQAAIALGNGSLYNHSYRPNAKYIKKYDLNEIHFIAIQNINVGDEILVNYNGDPADKSPLWFEVYK